MGVKIFFIKYVRVESGTELKRCIADAGIFDIFVGKLSYW